MTYFSRLGSQEMPDNQDDEETIELFRARCGRQETLIVTESFCALTGNQQDKKGTETDNRPMFKPLVLTDCCSLFRCVIKSQPSTLERCSRVFVSYLRDTQSMITFSIIDSDTNLGDVNTKHDGSLALLSGFFKSGCFALSFIGRKQSKSNRKGAPE